MTALYTYRRDSRYGLELKYSIRSMVKYFTPLTNVIISGDKPDWYTGDHTPCVDQPGKPGLNIANKILTACPDSDFLWCADDHFALHPFDENLPNYFNYTCQQARMIYGDPKLKRMLTQCPKGWLCYMVHCPMVMNGIKFKECFKGTEYPIKTMYANYHGLKGVRGKDIKINKPTSYLGIKHIIKDQPFFSTSEAAMNDNMVKVMEELYPEPSQYES